MRKCIGAIAACGVLSWLGLVQPTAAQGTSPALARSPLVLDVRELTPYVTSPGNRFVVHATNPGSRTIVSYGLIVLRRDEHARPRPLRRHVIRPRQGLPPRHQAFVPLHVPGPSPEYLVHATFVVFEDGTWTGDADAARQEVASLREEYAAARDIGVVLAGMPERPDRAVLVNLAGRLSQGLARASSRGARQQYEACLDTIARVLDERTRAGRTYEEALAIARVRVDRVLGRLEQYPFIATSHFKG